MATATKKAAKSTAKKSAKSGKATKKKVAAPRSPKTRLPANLPPHPGDVLAKRIADLHISRYHVGEATGAASAAIYQMIDIDGAGGRKRRDVTAQMALRLGKFFGEDPKFWLGIQMEYDLALAMADKAFAASLEQIQPYDPNAEGLHLSMPRRVVPKKGKRKTSTKKA